MLAVWFLHFISCIHKLFVVIFNSSPFSWYNRIARVNYLSKFHVKFFVKPVNHSGPTLLLWTWNVNSKHLPACFVNHVKQSNRFIRKQLYIIIVIRYWIHFFLLGELNLLKEHTQTGIERCRGNHRHILTKIHVYRRDGCRNHKNRAPMSQ